MHVLTLINGPNDGRGNRERDGELKEKNVLLTEAEAIWGSV